MFLIQTLFFVLPSSKEEGLPIRDPQSLQFSGTFCKPNGIKSSWEGEKAWNRKQLIRNIKKAPARARP